MCEWEGFGVWDGLWVCEGLEVLGVVVEVLMLVRGIEIVWEGDNGVVCGMGSGVWMQAGVEMLVG